MKNRSADYRIKQRHRHINKRKRIISTKYFRDVEQYGRLDKGKIHCSCPLCSEKTRTLTMRSGGTFKRKGKNWKHSDLKKIHNVNDFE